MSKKVLDEIFGREMPDGAMVEHCVSGKTCQVNCVTHGFGVAFQTDRKEAKSWLAFLEKATEATRNKAQKERAKKLQPSNDLHVQAVAKLNQNKPKLNEE